MADVRNNLEESFSELGVTYDEQTLQKCLEICQKYDITDAEEFVDSWMAYSVSHFKGDNPTIPYLLKFERDEYGRKTKDTPIPTDDHKRSLVIYEANRMDLDSEPSSDILSVYNETTPKSKPNSDKRHTTPESISSKRCRGNTTTHATFSPASFSPSIATPSSKYATRTNSGEVVLRYNDSGTAWDWKTDVKYTAKVEACHDVQDVCQYMCFDLIDCLDWADDNIEKLASIFCSKFSLEDVMPTKYKHSSPFVTVGRIACDSDGRLNAQSIILEGSRELSLGEAVQLDLSSVPKYSIFPGQVVAVEGINVTGDKFVAKEVYYDLSQATPPPPSLPRGPISIMVAAGPFTQSDSMIYQPLLDLIEQVSCNEPHALILTGPFIDCNHPFIIENTIAETYQDLFGKLVDQIMKPLEGKRTQVVLVSSYKDCHGHCVYPTPPLPLMSKTYPKIKLLPDPSLITIEDIIVGVTSTDILMHIGKEEISCPHSADRLSRLAGHVLSQRSFYPLFPPSEEVPLDATKLDQARLMEVPHILILPSDLRYFIKEVAGCTVVNPERLAKGVIGGTYATLLVESSKIIGNIVKI